MLNFYQPLGFQRTAFRSSMLRGSSLYGSCFAMLATPKVSIGNIMRYKQLGAKRPAQSVSCSSVQYGDCPCIEFSQML